MVSASTFVYSTAFPLESVSVEVPIFSPLTFSSPSVPAVSTAPVNVERCHVISTVTSPRALSPVTLPASQSAGIAARRSMESPWLWSSISVIPAVAPKLPSIWNGGWVSNRFVSVDSFNCSSTILCAWSPSLKRAQKLIFQALLHPVPPSPRVFRVSFIASMYWSSSSLLPATNCLPGCRP